MTKTTTNAIKQTRTQMHSQPQSSTLVPILIRLDEKLLKSLDRCAKKKGMNRTDMIREAIRIATQKML